ncbi:MAG TPA: hypothetical protein VIA08_00050 [Nitrososphaeraceae archaeon]
MEEKKRKKVSFTEAGGDHAASIAESGMETEVRNDFTYCHKCNQSFPSSNYWGHSPCFD